MNSSVSVAEALPAAPPDTCETETFGMSVASAKSDAARPPRNVAPLSATRTVAPCRFASVSARGLVAAMYARPVTAMRSSSRPTSPSSSSALTTTMLVASRVGVPQMVSGAVAQVAAVPAGSPPPCSRPRPCR